MYFSNVQKTPLVAFFLALFLFVPNQAIAAEMAGKIALVKGDVKILNAKRQIIAKGKKGKDGRTVTRGAPFYEGEIFQTSSSGRIKLEFTEGGNTVVLGPNTSLAIQRAGDGTTAKKGTDLELKQGTIRSEVKEKYSAQGDDVFQVKTPNAVAGVRGTIFNVNFDIKTAKTKVVTVEGLVSLVNRKAIAPQAGQRFNNANRGEVMVGAGSKSEMGADADVPSPPQKASATELKASEDMDQSVDDSGPGESGDAPQEGGSEASPASAQNEGEGSDAPVADAGPAPEKKEAEAESDEPAVALAPEPSDSMSEPEQEEPNFVAGGPEQGDVKSDGSVDNPQTESNQRAPASEGSDPNLASNDGSRSPDSTLPPPPEDGALLPPPPQSDGGGLMTAGGVENIDTTTVLPNAPSPFDVVQDFRDTVNDEVAQEIIEKNISDNNTATIRYKIE